MSLPKVRITASKYASATTIEIDGVQVQGCTGYALRQSIHERPIPVLLLRLLCDEVVVEGTAEVTEERKSLLEMDNRSLRARLTATRDELNRERELTRKLADTLALGQSDRDRQEETAGDYVPTAPLRQGP